LGRAQGQRGEGYVAKNDGAVDDRRGLRRSNTRQLLSYSRAARPERNSKRSRQLDSVAVPVRLVALVRSIPRRPQARKKSVAPEMADNEGGDLMTAKTVVDPRRQDNNKVRGEAMDMGSGRCRLLSRVAGVAQGAESGDGSQKCTSVGRMDKVGVGDVSTRKSLWRCLKSF
jgi:hypothetical protein